MMAIDIDNFGERFLPDFDVHWSYRTLKHSPEVTQAQWLIVA